MIHGITRLMRTAVFDGFDADTQRILPELSLLDSHYPGAVAVTGDKEAGDVIRGLADSNCFIRYEPRSGAYELHSILRDALKEVFPLDSRYGTLLIRCGIGASSAGVYQAIDFYAKAGFMTGSSMSMSLRALGTYRRRPGHHRCFQPY